MSNLIDAIERINYKDAASLENELIYNHNGVLERLKDHTDLEGSLEYNKNRVNFLKPKDKSLNYSSSRDYFGAQEDVKKIKEYQNQLKRRK